MHERSKPAKPIRFSFFNNFPPHVHSLTSRTASKQWIIISEKYRKEKLQKASQYRPGNLPLLSQIEVSEQDQQHSTTFSPIISVLHPRDRRAAMVIKHAMQHVSEHCCATTTCCCCCDTLLQRSWHVTKKVWSRERSKTSDGCFGGEVQC